MKRTTLIALAGTACLGALLALVGCEEKGPMERAGERLDEAADEVKERVERVGKDDGPLERFGRQVDELGDEIEEAGREVSEAAREVGK